MLKKQEMCFLNLVQVVKVTVHHETFASFSDIWFKNLYWLCFLPKKQTFIIYNKIILSETDVHFISVYRQDILIYLYNCRNILYYIVLSKLILLYSFFSIIKETALVLNI